MRTMAIKLEMDLIKRCTTPYIIYCQFQPTYENPRGFSIRFLFAKLGAYETNHTQIVVRHTENDKPI